MTRKFKAMVAAALIAAAAVPFIPATSQAASYAAEQNYWHKHDDNGWVTGPHTGIEPVRRNGRPIQPVVRLHTNTRRRATTATPGCRRSFS